MTPRPAPRALVRETPSTAGETVTDAPATAEASPSIETETTAPRGERSCRAARPRPDKSMMFAYPA
jgi:hypothetical protein